MARQSLAQLETEHLECRSWAHAWDYDVSYVERVGRMSVLELHLTCTRCKGGRVDRFNRSTGRLISRHYVYPKDYVVEKLERWGGRRRFNNNVRVELFRRFTTTAKPKARKGKRAA